MRNLTGQHPLITNVFEYMLSLLLVVQVTLLMLPFRNHLGIIEVLLVYLATITLASLLFTLRPSLISSFVAFLTFNFFYTIPYYTLSVEARGDIVALLAFLGLALLINQLVARIKRRTLEAIRRGRQTETLYLLSVALIRESDVRAIQQAIVEQVRTVFELAASAILLRGEDDQFTVAALAGEELDLLDRSLLAVARWSIENDEPAGFGTSRVRIQPPAALQRRRSAIRHEILFIPIRTRGAEQRLLLVARERGQRAFDEEESQHLATFANQAAIAIERTILVEEHTRAEILTRTDELKTALLSAVSHDLRTPLASIKASATALQQPDLNWREEDARVLIEMIDEEADRLNRLVTNLLDLSRIESGQLKPSLDWYRADTLIAEALDRCQTLLTEHTVSVDCPDSDAYVEIDFTMIVEVLVNLIENAAKYSPPHSNIEIATQVQHEWMSFTVTDEGQGVPRGEEERIFDKFYRVEAQHRPIGSGMGLAISRGFIEAHAGHIGVQPNPDNGSTFYFTVPLVQELVCEPAAPEIREKESVRC